MELENLLNPREMALSPMPHISKLNPAKWTYDRLSEYINKFESRLNETQEIGARLVSFGPAIVLNIDDLGYHGPDIIWFDGTNEQGERVRLIQNVSQLSVMLVAVKKQHDKPRRIGFRLAEASKESLGQESDKGR
jgi:hypothetical protein